jgi:hypothetical protein
MSKFTQTLLTALIGVFISLNVYGSAQMADKMVYADSIYSLETNPLQQYLRLNPDKNPLAVVRPSSLLRGYVATFCIADNKLMVKDVEILSLTKTIANKDSFAWVSTMKTVSPDQNQLFCNWFSGYLILTKGKMVKRIHMSYASTYENYILIKIIDGKKISEQKMTNEEYSKFKDVQFEAFKKTKDYELILEDWKKRENSTGNPDDSFRLFVPMYSTQIFDR